MRSCFCCSALVMHLIFSKFVCVKGAEIRKKCLYLKGLARHICLAIFTWDVSLIEESNHEYFRPTAAEIN